MVLPLPLPIGGYGLTDYLRTMRFLCAECSITTSGKIIPVDWIALGIGTLTYTLESTKHIETMIHSEDDMDNKEVAYIDKTHYGNHYGYLCITEHINGWAGSGFNSRTTDIQVRTVESGNAQIEITISELKGDKERLYEHSGSLTLTPDVIAALVKALTKH